jgi:hypothetical protein
MKNNLTAVEWFFKWQNDNFEATVVEEIVAYETAKAMEREQEQLARNDSYSQGWLECTQYIMKHTKQEEK